MERQRRGASTSGAAELDEGAAPEAEADARGNAAVQEDLGGLWSDALATSDPSDAAGQFLGLQADERSDSDGRATAAFDRGRMLERAGDLESAVIAYEEAWKSTARGDAAHEAAGDALDRLRPQVGEFGRAQLRTTVEGAMQLAEAERWDEALAAFEAAQAHTRGQDPDVQFDIAMCYAHTGRATEATAILASLADDRGLSPDRRSQVEEELGKLRGGQMPREAEPEAAPDTPEAFQTTLDRAIDALHAGRVGESLALHLALEQSPVLGPARGAVMFNLGMLWSRLGVKSRALPALQEALDSGQLDPAAAADADRRINEALGLPAQPASPTAAGHAAGHGGGRRGHGGSAGSGARTGGSESSTATGPVETGPDRAAADEEEEDEEAPEARVSPAASTGWADDAANTVHDTMGAGTGVYDTLTNNGVGTYTTIASEMSPAVAAVTGPMGVALNPMGVLQGAQQFEHGLDAIAHGDAERGILDTTAGAAGVTSSTIATVGTLGELGIEGAAAAAGAGTAAAAVGTVAGGFAGGVAIGDRGNSYARETGVAGTRTRAGRGVGAADTTTNRDWSDMAVDWGESGRELGGGPGTVGGEMLGVAGVAAGSVVGAAGAAVTGVAGIATDAVGAADTLVHSDPHSDFSDIQARDDEQRGVPIEESAPEVRTHRRRHRREHHDRDQAQAAANSAAQAQRDRDAAADGVVRIDPDRSDGALGITPFRVEQRAMAILRQRARERGEIAPDLSEMDSARAEARQQLEQEMAGSR